jgi:hypothetical protein
MSLGRFILLLSQLQQVAAAHGCGFFEPRDKEPYENQHARNAQTHEDFYRRHFCLPDGGASNLPAPLNLIID